MGAAKTCTTIGVFTTTALVTLGVLLLAKSICKGNGNDRGNMALLANSKAFNIIAVCSTVFVSTFSGGIAWQAQFSESGGTYVIWLSCGLLLTMLVFGCFGSRSAGNVGGGEGFFRDNGSRIAISGFMSVSAGALFSTFS